MEKEVFSAHSGRLLSVIELIDVTLPLETNVNYSFRVLEGFGNMWRKSFAQENMTLKNAEGKEVILNILAFPSEKEGIGILSIGMVLPPRPKGQNGTAEQQKLSPSLFKRMRGYLTRPRA